MPGAGWVKALYGAVMFLIKYGRDLGDMLVAAKDAIVHLIKDKGAAAAEYISDKVVGGLEKGLEVIFKGLAVFFGIDGLPKELSTVLNDVQDAVDTPIEKVVEVVAGPAVALVSKFTEKVDPADREGMIGTPYVSPDGKAVVWADAEGLQVSMSKKMQLGGPEDVKEWMQAIQDEQKAMEDVKALTPPKGSKKKKSPALKEAMRKVKDARGRKKKIAWKLIAQKEKMAGKAGMGKYRGGRYRDLSGMNKAFSGDELEAHHTPAKDAYKNLKLGTSGQELSYLDGPAIQMKKKDHADTTSNGSSDEADKYRESQRAFIEKKKFGKAIKKDIEDIERIAKDAGDPTRYDEAIKEMKASLDPWMRIGL